MATDDEVTALLEHVGAQESEAAGAAGIYDEASALVLHYCGVNSADVPVAVLAGSILDVAAKLWQRRASVSGQVQLDTLDGSPILTPRDPMVTAYPVLDRFLPLAFG